VNRNHPQKDVARRGHGKSPLKPVVEEKLEETEEEKRPVKKGKKTPPPEEDFQFTQPLINLGRHPLIQRAKKCSLETRPVLRESIGITRPVLTNNGDLEA